METRNRGLEILFLVNLINLIILINPINPIFVLDLPEA